MNITHAGTITGTYTKCKGFMIVQNMLCHGPVGKKTLEEASFFAVMKVDLPLC
jgi:hypothetical protein